MGWEERDKRCDEGRDTRDGMRERETRDGMRGERQEMR